MQMLLVKKTPIKYTTPLANALIKKPNNKNQDLTKNLTPCLGSDRKKTIKPHSKKGIKKGQVNKPLPFHYIRKIL